VFNYLLEATLFGGVLILLLFAVRVLLRTRLGSRAIYIAWLLVALRLLLPLSIPNPVMDEFRPGFSTDVAARPVADQVRQRVIDAGREMASLLGTEEDGALSTFTRRTDEGRTGRWVLLVWAGAAIGTCGWLLWRIERFARNARRNRVQALEGEQLQLYHELCALYRVKPIPVYYTDRLPAGCVAGVLHPFIGIPLHTPRAHLPLLLSHQICHLRAHDPLWGVVRCLCCGVHWFNPLVWMAAWFSWIDSELACDDRVTARLPDLDRLAYADVIASAGRRSGDAMVSADAVGASFTDRHIRQRVTSVIRCVRGSRTAAALGSLAAAVILTVSFATGESEPLPTIAAVPPVEWAASAVPIDSEAEALACARRFLESDFVGEDTSAYSFAMRTNGTQWQIDAQNRTQSQPVSLIFSQNGRLVRYDALCLLDGLRFSDSSYTHRTYTESVKNYISAFMTALVPDCFWQTGSIITDARAGDVRVLQCELRNEGSAVCLFTLQVRLLQCETRE